MVYVFWLQPPTAIVTRRCGFLVQTDVAPRIVCRKNVQPRFWLTRELVMLQHDVCHIRSTRNDDGCLHDRQLVTAHNAIALVHAHRTIIAPCPYALVIGLDPSHTRPTRASSPLTNFPKQDSHHPMHPYPNIPVIRAPRPHAYESVASSLARHLIPHVHARIFTP